MLQRIVPLVVHAAGASLVFGASPPPAAQPAAKPAAVATATKPDAAATKPPSPSAPAADPAEVREGHSYHGEAFDEGPRQAAYLMAGMGNVSFQITTKVPEAQRFFNQGVAQLHGFWYFEAERSFRQAAALDPDCAMAYWGLCAANVNNAKRAAKFIEEAVERRAKASRREQLWIDAWSAYHKDPKADPKTDKPRRQALVKAIENIIHEYPDDLEAKAYLVLVVWLNRGQIPYGSHQAVDALIDQVLERNPMHPIHHYRIHLWDDEKAQRALKSAALCGQATPGIAHMWHMSGHTFSKLQRYDDAAWQQEAASRTDHAYMMRDYVMPDQIHNYAHNHEWLIRDLSHQGRVRYGLELAKNLIEMPRHPKYNTTARNGSAGYGRARLIELLQRYELWSDAVALSKTPYLEPTDLPREQVKRLRLLGAALYQTGAKAEGAQATKELETLLAKEQAAQKSAADKAEAAAKQKKEPADKVTKARNDAMNPLRAQIALLEGALAEVRGHAAFADAKYADALAHFKKAGLTSGEFIARVQLASGNKAEAEKLARAAATSNKNQVVPQANLVYVLWKCGKTSEAKSLFQELRSSASVADVNVPVFARLAPLAEELKLPRDRRSAPPTKTDVGVRPPLDSLGPIRWRPSPAPQFVLKTADGRPFSSSQFRGRPVVYVFYLGFGCLHCVEQLKALAPLYSEFKSAGIEVVAVSTDSAEALRKAAADLDKQDSYPFPIVPNDDLAVFKKYRAYDDFEKQPLHATVLVDGAGFIRWIDGGAEPFMDLKFLLAESMRLLSLPGVAPSQTAAAAPGSGSAE